MVIVVRRRVDFLARSEDISLGLLDPSRLPVAGVEVSRKVLDPSRPSNELMRPR